MYTTTFWFQVPVQHVETWVVGSQPRNGPTIVAAIFVQNPSKNLFVQRCQMEETQQIRQIIYLALPPQAILLQKFRDRTKKRKRKITTGKFFGEMLNSI